jgi:SAM-dependent methyltransferase
MGSRSDWRSDAAANRTHWTRSNHEYTDANAWDNWALDTIHWGIWAQLETARRLMAETGIEFPLVEADAGETGLPDASFDLALSEYGASIWVDPYRWIPEAARLLRPGGRLVFLRNSTLAVLCSPDDEEAPVGTTLARPQFGLHRLAWQDGSVEFQLGHGEWIDLLRANGFAIERLVEVQAPADAETHPYYSLVTAEWARQWPCEEIWVARKEAG